MYSSTLGEGGEPKTRCRRPGRGGLTCCSLVSSTNGVRTLSGTRVHQGGPGSLCAIPNMASGAFWRLMQDSFGWRWRGCVCTAATSSRTTPWKSKLRFSSLRKTSASLHYPCIEFSIQKRSQPVNTGRGGKRRGPSWNTRRLSNDMLRENLEKTRLIDRLDWAKSAGSLENTVQAIKRRVVAECDHSMFRRGHMRIKNLMYWWNDQLSALRRKCFTARWKYTCSKCDALLHEAWKTTETASRGCIKKSRFQCWKDLIGEVKKDPWSLAFKIVTKRLVTRRKTRRSFWKSLTPVFGREGSSTNGRDRGWSVSEKERNLWRMPHPIDREQSLGEPVRLILISVIYAFNTAK